MIPDFEIDFDDKKDVDDTTSQLFMEELLSQPLKTERILEGKKEQIEKPLSKFENAMATNFIAAINGADVERLQSLVDSFNESSDSLNRVLTSVERNINRGRQAGENRTGDQHINLSWESGTRRNQNGQTENFVGLNINRATFWGGSHTVQLRTGCEPTFSRESGGGFPDQPAAGSAREVLQWCTSTNLEFPVDGWQSRKKR